MLDSVRVWPYGTSFFGIASPIAFRTVEFTTVGSNGDVFELDDVRFSGPNIVPEPNSALLAWSAIACVAILRG